MTDFHADDGDVSAARLEAAIAAGILTRAQLEAIRGIELPAAPTDANPDDEQFRFIRGFGDIFVTIGLALFIGATAYFAAAAGGVFLSLAVSAAASWALAEYFTRKRRMALPSIVLLLVFAYSVFGFASLLLLALTGETEAGLFEAFHAPQALPLIGGGLATALAMIAHYRRFRVPITVAAGVGGLVALAVGLALAAGAPRNPALLVAGVAVFVVAMRFDLSDPARTTRRTDIAFWLHMLAAPLIVHPLIGSFFDRTALFSGGAPGPGTALAILAVFAGLAVLALIVDRRAILVSALSYAGIAFGTLFGVAGLAGPVPLTLLVLGAVVLILSAGWHSLRGFLLGLLPASLSRRLAYSPS